MPIILEQQSISRISGPVSMTILAPSEHDAKTHFEKYGTYLPIFILFGDVHYSLAHSCSDCLPPSCYPVYDPSFLRLLDNASARQQHKSNIDVYMEGYFPTKTVLQQQFKEQKKESNQHDNLSLLAELQDHESSQEESREKKDGQQEQPTQLEPSMLGILNSYKRCYNKYIREKSPREYLRDCPTSNLRWHYSDARQLDESKPGKYMLETWLFQINLWLCNTMTNVLTNLPDPSVKKHDHQLKKEITTYIQDVLLSLKEMFYTQWLGSKDDTFKSIFELLRRQMQLRDHEQFLNLFFNGNSDITKLSIIHKQLKKVVKRSLIKKQFWLSSFSEYYAVKIHRTAHRELLNMTVSDTKQLFLEYLITSYIELLSLVEEFCLQTNAKNKATTHKVEKWLYKFLPTFGVPGMSVAIKGYIISLNSWFLDMYFILRCFKKPKGSQNAIMNVAYFGDFHVENLVSYLTHVFHYNIVYQHCRTTKLPNSDMSKYQDSSRCIEIPAYVHVDLDQMLDVYANVNLNV